MTRNSRAQAASVASQAWIMYAYNDAATPPHHIATVSGVPQSFTRTYFDGFGRAIKVETGHSGTTVVSTVETEYEPCACSPLGKVKRVTRPYAPAGDKYWTTYNYDALGRTISVVLPAGAGTTTYLYEGNTVKSTDPAGKWKTFITDAVGNLTKVTEPNPAGGTWDTLYTYNVRNQLTQVSMTRGAATQLRTFVYDANGRLTSATNPETGTVTYTYNPNNGKVQDRVDARNQKISHFYDNYNRLVSKYAYAAGAGSPTYITSFTYDSTAAAGCGVNTAGRLAEVMYRGKVEGNTEGTFRECFNYTAGGLPTRKKLIFSREAFFQGNLATGSLEANYTYNEHGQVTSVSYPSYHVNSGGTWTPVTGPTYTTGYDAMRRPLSLTENGSTTLAYGALYNASNQLAQYAYEGWIETRQYNVLGQLTRITVPSVFDMEYRFSATQNNGRVTQQKDWITGEEITYTYDSLKRLATAATTSTAWGLSFTYDGFGNKTAQSLTKGTGPTHTLAVDGNTNRIVGATYDANGNQYPTSGEVFDVDNRMTYTPGAQYAYDSQNRRVYKLSGAFEMTFYGIEGRRLATYQVNLTFPNVVHFTETSRNIYFGGKLLRTGGASVILDRLGSVRYRKQGATTERLDFWPYGEEKPGATAQDREKFATYYRDPTGLDYADQRYYHSQHGRFLTPDPYKASAGASKPSSWNRYTYVEGDPANARDPKGLRTCFYVNGELDSCEEDPSDCDQMLMASDTACGPGGSPGGSPDGFEEKNGNNEPPVGAGGSSDEPEPEQEPEQAKPRLVWCDDAVIGAMKTAWAQSANGTSGVEAGFRLDGTPSTYKVIPTPFTNQQMMQEMKVVPGETFSVYHVHPNRGDPKPSKNDMMVGDKFKIEMYTMSTSGLYKYDPTTKKTEFLRPGLAWTQPCN